MKILHIVPSLNPELGGPTEAALNLVRSLRAIGADAELLSTNDMGADRLDVELNQRVMFEGVPVWFFERSWLRKKEFIFSWPMTAWLWKHIHNYDIIETHYLFTYSTTCATAIARRARVPYTMRTTGQLAPWALSSKPLRKRVYRALFESRTLNRAAAIHCTAEGEAEDVKRYGVVVPTVHIPLGVNPAEPIENASEKLRERYSIPADVPIVLYLSRLHEKKQPDLLIRALAALAQQGRQCHLILAGSADERYAKYLSELVASHGLESGVTFTGFVRGAAKNLLLQGSDLFALPTFSENFGIAIVEALAAGLPVIITKGVQISEQVAGAGAGLVIDPQLLPLTSALATLIDSPVLRRELGANGARLTRECFQWEKVAKRLFSTYSAILQKQPVEFHPLERANAE